MDNSFDLSPFQLSPTSSTERKKVYIGLFVSEIGISNTFSQNEQIPNHLLGDTDPSLSPPHHR